MENIKVVDMHEATSLSEQDMNHVKGGAAYIKFDGVDGESKHRDHAKWSDLVSFSSPVYR